MRDFVILIFRARFKAKAYRFNDDARAYERFTQNAMSRFNTMGVLGSIDAISLDSEPEARLPPRARCLVDDAVSLPIMFEWSYTSASVPRRCLTSIIDVRLRGARRAALGCYLNNMLCFCPVYTGACKILVKISLIR